MATPDSILLDPVSENAANSQLELNDGTGYFLLEHDYPEPEIEALYASSADTEGDVPVSLRPKNRVIPVKLRVVGTTALDLDQKLGVIAQKVGKFRREGGTYKRTTPSGLTIVFDVLPESGMSSVTFDRRYLTRLKSEVDLRFVCAPYGRGLEVANVADDFSADTIGGASPKYTFDAGGGSIAVTAGQLVPSSVAEKRFYRSGEGLTYPDAQTTIKVTTGASVASGSTALVLRRTGANDYLRASVNFAGAASTLTIEKVVGGAAAQLGPATGAFTTNAATSYWLRFRCEGNKLTVELWTAAPTPTGSPAQSLPYTLAGADATALGLGVSGGAGLRLIPQATDYRWDDFLIEPYLYVETTNPVLVTPPIYGLKGDVLARGRLVLQELASQDQWWAIYGNESRYFSKGVPTILDQFGADTIGSGAWASDAGAGTIAVAGGLLVPSSVAEKRLFRTDPGAATDAAVTVKYTTGASVASGLVGLIARRSDANNHLLAQIEVTGAASIARIYKFDSGTYSGILASSANFTLAAATTYWAKLIVQGSTLTVEHYTADPASGAARVAFATYQLTAAEAAKYTAGQSGLRILPAGTDYRYDDFRVQPLQGCTEALIDSESLIVSGYAGAFFSPRTGAFTGGTQANHVVLTTLTNQYASTCSTPALGHVGQYRVFARMYRPKQNKGAVSVALEWSTGDFSSVVRNDPTSFAADGDNAAAGDREEAFTLTDLGTIQVPPAVKGVQQWRGQVIAKSTVVGDTVEIDYLVLVPYAEASGEVRAPLRAQTPAALTIRDEFDQAAGNLNGKVLPAGGTWATAGADATDLAVEITGHTAQRATTSDASGKTAIAGTTTFTNVAARLDIKASALGGSTLMQGLYLRYTDANNYLLASVVFNSSGLFLRLNAFAGGALQFQTQSPVVYNAGTNYTLVAVALASGVVAMAIVPQGTDPITAWDFQVSHSSLATGGALASGKVGFFDLNMGVVAITRNYDNFAVWAPTPDAVLFSGRQAEFRHDGFVRQDAAGAIWADKTVEGDYLRLIPAGREGRQNRLVIDTCRNDPETGQDPSLSKIQAQLLHTPRYLNVPAS